MHATVETLRHAFTGGWRTIVILSHWRTCDINGFDVRDAQAIASRLGLEGNAQAIVEQLNAWITRQACPDDARDILDLEFRDVLVPGSCLELRDGYHKPDDLLATIPKGWSGTIDFVVCHSARIAFKLKDNNCDRIVLTNEKERLPARAVPELMYTLKILTSGQYDYVSAKQKAFLAFSAAILRED